ncbi:hypothetical protein [Zavarzinella formosa]|uniref:hypothetical protein n=1 Tax=Zavarzinella formosa TaxID=360055 RepID=UPI00059291AE|nr:hypothetical protein [Zavarzinella formosa]
MIESAVTPVESLPEERSVSERSGNRRRILFVVLAMIISLPISCVTTIVLNLKSNRVVRQWNQPAEISYKSFDPYSLSVIEGSVDWANLSFPRRHQLVIAVGPGHPTYGHMIDYSFNSGGDDIDEHIGRSRVEWSDDGVTFIEVTGHRLFVPKAMFIGGR